MIASTHSSCTLSTQFQKLLIRFEHIRLLHAGPSLFLASLSRHFHLVRGHSLIRSITRSAITSAARCQRNHLTSARLKALHGTSSPNVLLTMGGGSQKYEETPFSSSGQCKTHQDNCWQRRTRSSIVTVNLRRELEPTYVM